MGAKKHFESKCSEEAAWKSSVKNFPDKDAQREPRKQGVKYLAPEFSEPKVRPEKKHIAKGG